MRNRAFTLLEVVLAIGLAGAILGLLTTAIDLYLVRVDTTRTQVESAQLARTLLKQLASDIHAARYFSPSSPQSNSSGDSATDSSLVQGIFGTETELRIDRSAVWQWESLARQWDTTDPSVETDSTPNQSTMPQTVRYLLGEGKELLAAELAATGVGEQPLALGYAGLYREQLSTAAWLEQNSDSEGTLGSNETENAELIAPEVVEIVFAYFDGQELRTEWDSSVEEGLPKGIEIRLTLLEEPLEEAVTRTPSDRAELRRSQENLVEYRRFVKLPDVRQPQEADFPQQAKPSSGSPNVGSGL